MHYGRSDSDEEPSSQIVLDRPSISQPRSSSPLRSLSPAPSQSDLNTELLNNFLSTQLSKASKPSSIHITDRVKRARLVGPGGACITSTESQSILEAEVNERLQRKIDADRVKQEREIKRRKLDAAAIRKKELASIKKINKARETCHECTIEKKRDKNKVKWLHCFDCGKWCCADCLPSVFSTACSQVYRCESCLIDLNRTNEE